MSVVPTAHGASHAADGNDPIGDVGVLTLGAGGYAVLTEIADPSGTPAAGTAFLYVADNAGNTELRIKYDDGSVNVVDSMAS